MNHKPEAGCIILVFLLALAGICTGAGADQYLATLAGGESTIGNDTDDVMIITVFNPDPFVNITKDDNTTQMPVGLLGSASLPFHAVGVFSTPKTRSVSLVTIENLSISDTNDTLTLLGKPLDYYDGEILMPYVLDTVHLQELDAKTFNHTGLYFEMIQKIPDNSNDERLTFEKCIADCHGDSTCIWECDEYC